MMNNGARAAVPPPDRRLLMPTVLIAEDEPPIANLIKLSLAKAGYVCTCAYDGSTAADLAADTSFEQRVRGLHEGAEDYTVKPFEVDELLARLDVVLRRYGKAQGILEAGDLAIVLFARNPNDPAPSTDDAIAGDSTAGASAVASCPRDDWCLTLVNPPHPIDPSYTVTLAVTENGFEVDERCLPDLERMLDMPQRRLRPFHLLGVPDARRRTGAPVRAAGASGDGRKAVRGRGAPEGQHRDGRARHERASTGTRARHRRLQRSEPRRCAGRHACTSLLARAQLGV